VRGSRTDCFVATSAARLAQITYDGSSWGAWASRGGNATGRPACVPAASGLGLDCFYVDANNALQTVRISGTTVGAPKKIGSGFGLAPQCVATGSKLDCFAQSASKQLLKGYFNGTSWATWTNLGGNVGATPSCSRTSSTTNPDFDCFWTTSGFNLVERQRLGGTWRPEVNLGGAVQQQPTCLSRDGGARKDCLARGTDNSLQQKSYR